MGREAGDARGLTFQTPEPAASRAVAGMRGHRGRRDVQSVDRGLILRVYFERMETLVACLDLTRHL